MQIALRVFVILIIAHSAMARSVVLGHESPQETPIIIVNERTLVGPNSSVQVRGGRLFLPVAAIAQALGDTFSSDAALRIVTVRRQTGSTAIFNASLNEVRENGAVILTVSGTADLIFPPTIAFLLYPERCRYAYSF